MDGWGRRPCHERVHLNVRKDKSEMSGKIRGGGRGLPAGTIVTPNFDPALRDGIKFGVGIFLYEILG